MGDVMKISRHVPSTCAPNAVFSLLIIHIIRRCQTNVAIDNPSLVLSVSCLTTSSCLLSFVRAADNVSQTETFKATAASVVSVVQISKQDPGYPSYQVLW